MHGYAAGPEGVPTAMTPGTTSTAESAMRPLLAANCAVVALEDSVRQTPPDAAQPEQACSSMQPTNKSPAGQATRKSISHSNQVAKKARLQLPTQQQQASPVVVLTPTEQQQAVPVQAFIPGKQQQAVAAEATTPADDQPVMPAVTVQALTAAKQQAASVVTLAPAEQQQEAQAEASTTPEEQHAELAAPVQALASADQQKAVPVKTAPPAEDQQAVPIEALTPPEQQQQQQQAVPAAPVQALPTAQQQQAMPVKTVTPAENQQAVPTVALTPAEQQQQQQQQQQTVPAAPLDALTPKKQQQAMPLEASTPAELGRALLVHGVLSERVSSFGCQAGQWVADDTILAILDAICSDEASTLTHAGQSFELVACYLNSQDSSVDTPNLDLTAPPQQPQCILVVHTSADGTGQHFSSLIINPEHQVMHAFDSLGRWSDQQVNAVLQGLYPNVDLLGQHGYRLSNSTGKIRQTGATCGPWALWSLVAYVFNYKQCRHASSDVIDCAVLRGGALPFWRAVTC